MRTTITIDDELFRKAVEVAGPGLDRSEIVREAMRVFVRVQSGKRLAALGGAAPRERTLGDLRMLRQAKVATTA